MVTRRQFVTGFSAIPVLSYLKFDSVFAATPASILVMAIQLDIITSLDPHESFESVGSEITGNMYQQLVKPKLASPDEIEGDLARSWTASDDKKPLPSNWIRKPNGPTANRLPLKMPRSPCNA